MSVPVGPHGSLLVAMNTRQPGKAELWVQLHTIANLDLDMGVSFGHILHTPYDLRHRCGGWAATWSILMAKTIICELRACKPVGLSTCWRCAGKPTRANPSCLESKCHLGEKAGFDGHRFLGRVVHLDQCYAEWGTGKGSSCVNENWINWRRIAMTSWNERWVKKSLSLVIHSWHWLGLVMLSPPYNCLLAVTLWNEATQAPPSGCTTINSLP